MPNNYVYKTVGRKLKLLACFWNATTMWLLNNHHRRSTRQRRHREEDIEAGIPLEPMRESNRSHLQRAITLPALKFTQMQGLRTFASDSGPINSYVWESADENEKSKTCGINIDPEPKQKKVSIASDEKDTKKRREYDSDE
jgi:hypothetical protein